MDGQIQTCLSWRPPPPKRSLLIFSPWPQPLSIETTISIVHLFNQHQLFLLRPIRLPFYSFHFENYFLADDIFVPEVRGVSRLVPYEHKNYSQSQTQLSFS